MRVLDVALFLAHMYIIHLYPLLYFTRSPVIPNMTVLRPVWDIKADVIFNSGRRNICAFPFKKHLNNNIYLIIVISFPRGSTFSFPEAALYHNI